MLNRDMIIGGLAFGAGFWLRKQFLRQEAAEVAETQEKVNQDIALHTEATTTFMRLLNVGQVDSAIEFWNEHVDFMKAIENY